MVSFREPFNIAMDKGAVPVPPITRAVPSPPPARVEIAEHGNVADKLMERAAPSPPPEGKCADTHFPEPIGKELEGRKVVKHFDGVPYSGVVKRYTKKQDWYRIVYSDGDLEDLDYRSLSEILQ